MRKLLLLAALVAVLATPARATLTTTNSTISYTSNGVAVAYAVPFRFLDTSHLVVQKTVSSVTTTLVLGTDYSVTGANAAAGGTVTLNVAVANGGTVKISRSTPKTQPTSLRSQGAFAPKTLEDMADRETMIAQEMNDGTFTQLLATPVTTAQATTAAPSTVPNSTNTNVEGSSSAFARADHSHALAVGPMAAATSTAAQSIPNNVSTIVVFGTEERDTDAAYDNVTGRFTVPANKGGDYFVGGSIVYSAASGVTPSVSIFKNAAAIRTNNSGANTPGAGVSLSVSGVMNFAAGDIVDIRTIQVSGGPVTLTATAAHNFFSIKRIQ